MYRDGGTYSSAVSSSESLAHSSSDSLADCDSDTDSYTCSDAGTYRCTNTIAITGTNARAYLYAHSSTHPSAHSSTNNRIANRGTDGGGEGGRGKVGHFMDKLGMGREPLAWTHIMSEHSLWVVDKSGLCTDDASRLLPYYCDVWNLLLASQVHLWVRKYGQG